VGAGFFAVLAQRPLLSLPSVASLGSANLPIGVLASPRGNPVLPLAANLVLCGSAPVFFAVCNKSIKVLTRFPSSDNLRSQRHWPVKPSRQCVLLLAAVLASLGVSAAQSKPGFDAASIKASGERHDAPGVTRPPEFGVRITPDRLRAANVSVRQLVYLAYNLRPFQLTGGPDWVDTDLFTIDATAASPLTRKDILLRLQTLLEDRFQLQLSSQPQSMSVYALVAAQGGLKTVAPDAKPDAVPAWQVITTLTGGSQVADFLDGGPGLGKPVIDQTGAADTDRFFVKLSVDPSCETNSVADCGAQKPQGAALTRLLHEQLGMELKPTTADIPVFRIQSVSHPTPN
jgi:uncharacterized protein (TIGR03435 family)